MKTRNDVHTLWMPFPQGKMLSTPYGSHFTDGETALSGYSGAFTDCITTKAPSLAHAKLGAYYIYSPSSQEGGKGEVPLLFFGGGLNGAEAVKILHLEVLDVGGLAENVFFCHANIDIG